MALVGGSCWYISLLQMAVPMKRATRRQIPRNQPFPAGSIFAFAPSPTPTPLHSSPLVFIIGKTYYFLKELKYCTNGTKWTKREKKNRHVLVRNSMKIWTTRNLSLNFLQALKTVMVDLIVSCCKNVSNKHWTTFYCERNWVAPNLYVQLKWKPWYLESMLDHDFDVVPWISKFCCVLSWFLPFWTCFCNLCEVMDR